MANSLTPILMTHRIFFRHKFRRSNRQTMPGWQSPMMRELRIQLVIEIPATQKISVEIVFFQDIQNIQSGNFRSRGKYWYYNYVFFCNGMIEVFQMLMNSCENYNTK